MDGVNEQMKMADFKPFGSKCEKTNLWTKVAKLAKPQGRKWCGLTTTAFNMLPVGCLDGGRVVQGAFGKDALVGFGLTTYSLLGFGVLGGPLSLPWGLYVLICQRAPEKPCLNDVTEVGTWRRTAVTVAIFLVVLILLPVWDELAEELGIGLVTTF